jgi:hypothetical protein
MIDICNFLPIVFSPRVLGLFKASFGELSFNVNYQHSRRNAGVVSDGNHGQSRVQIQHTSDGNVNEIDASNVAILLLIPEKTYMAELYTRHASKHQTKEKVSKYGLCTCNH